MATIDDIKMAFRDFVIDGDPRSGNHNLAKADFIRTMLAILQAQGNPEALDAIQTALATKASAQSVSDEATARQKALSDISDRGARTYISRQDAVDRITANRPPAGVMRITVLEGGVQVYRAPTAFADDPLFPEGSANGRWGVVERVDLPAESQARAELAVEVGKKAAKTEVAVLSTELDKKAPQTAVDAEVAARREGQRLTSAVLMPVQDRTAALVDLEPIPFGARLMQPEELTFDLEPTRGYWLDTGLSWTPGDPLADQIAVTDLDGITVTDWSFDLQPLRGYVTATGAPWPAGTAPQMQVEVVSPTLVHVYIRQSGATYVRWELRHDVIPERNCDVWRIGSCHHVLRLGTIYTVVREIAFNGETDVAILLALAPGSAPPKPDHIGGAIHGNEQMLHATLLVNGAAFDPATAPAGLIDASVIEVMQASDMFEPGNSDATVWAPKGPLIMRHYKRLVLTADGWWNQQSHVAHVVGGFSVRNAFFGMLCLSWGSRGINTVHTAARAPLWAPEDVSTYGFPTIVDKAPQLKAWGDLYGAEVDLVRGWDAERRNIYIDNRNDRRKIYPDFFEGTVTDTALPWDIATRYRITIKEA